MTMKINEKKNRLKERSTLAKCGSLIKTLMIYGTVAGIVLPMIYAMWSERQKATSDLMDEMKKNRESQENMSSEDI